MMTKALAFVFLAVAVSACNLATNGGDPGTNSPSVDSEHMQFQTGSGYEVVSRSEVTGASVSVYGDDRSQAFDKYFPGDAARVLLAPIAFHQPQEFGLPGSRTTGEITIYYRNESRLLSIKNGNVVEDPLYPMVHYRSSVNLDSHWIGD